MTAVSPLSELPLGARGRIVEIHGGRQLAQRLQGLGLRIGSEVVLLHQRGSGVVVSVGSTRLALGGGIVEKLLVTPLGSPGMDAQERIHQD